MIIAANLKTNMTRSKTIIYIKEVDSFAQTTSQDVFVFPAMSSLDDFHTTKTVVGAQNAYPTVNGAFTGEIGLEHLEEFNLKTILIGHSERRHILGETQEFIVDKFNFFKEKGFKIIYCIGEPLEIREAGNETMMQYISAQYEGIDTKYENLIIAYEPVWAIGTGRMPTLEDIQNIHTQLKKKSPAPLLYGGSVKVNNTKDILNIENVDGILVGSAALNADDFSTMIQIAQEIENKK
ncbi:triose-phosphate isomerase [Sulfurimonas sp.]|uniref:triose-phosphate isomerase n=1 Tax=Sulfurimonas sp. TaxID=2022749 RepID=UPI002611CEEB|nr:triose-phosphate isomerase [Sulfurimonas sp.]